jgi:hypothetical protein
MHVTRPPINGQIDREVPDVHGERHPAKEAEGGPRQESLRQPIWLCGGRCRKHEHDGCNDEDDALGLQERSGAQLGREQDDCHCAATQQQHERKTVASQPNEQQGSKMLTTTMVAAKVVQVDASV